MLDFGLSSARSGSAFSSAYCCARENVPAETAFANLTIVFLDHLLARHETTSEGPANDDDVPDVPEQPVSPPGDLWHLGHHRVLCGDATDPKSCGRVLDGTAVQLIWTDPPYNVNDANSLKDKLRGKDRPILNDNPGEDFQLFLLGALEPMLSHCTGAAYIAMSSSELDTRQSACRLTGGHWSTFII